MSNKYNDYPSIHKRKKAHLLKSVGGGLQGTLGLANTMTIAASSSSATQSAEAIATAVPFLKKTVTGAVTLAQSTGAKGIGGAYGTLATVISGATVSTGGLALAGITAGGMIVTTVLSGKSAIKTHRHIQGLKNICSSPPANCTGSYVEHSYILGTILPYIIAKKGAKRLRKGAIAGTLSMYGPVELVRKVAKAGYKKARGTKGVKRSLYAHFLAKHLVTCRCHLADRIVAELYNDDNMQEIKLMDSRQAADLLGAKMKSV